MHLKALNELLNRFREGGAYRVTAHVDLETVPRVSTKAEVLALRKRQRQTANCRPLGYPISESGQGPKEIILIGHIVEQPPAREAGLLISDAVNNLRAALDHVVWQLSIARASPPNPIPRKPDSAWRHIGWPITLDSSEWHVQSSQKLFFIEKSVRTIFKPLQPFYRRPNDPEGDEFAILDEFWKVYKHRHLPLTEAWVGIDQVLSTMTRWAEMHPGAEALTSADFALPDPFEPVVRETAEERAHRVERWRDALRQHSFTIVSEHALGPFEDGAELGRIRESGPVYSDWPQMHVDPKLAIDIAFGPGAIA